MEQAIHTTLKTDYKNVCDRYLKSFCDKHGYDADYEMHYGYVWVGDNPGTVANICDMWIDFDDIRYDIDNDISEEKFEKWYWKSLDQAEMNLKFLNYPSFCKGAPDPISPEQMARIEEARARLAEAKKLFQDAIKDYKPKEVTKYDSHRRCSKLKMEL